MYELDISKVDQKIVHLMVKDVDLLWQYYCHDQMLMEDLFVDHQDDIVADDLLYLIYLQVEHLDLIKNKYFKSFLWKIFPIFRIKIKLKKYFLNE